MEVELVAWVVGELVAWLVVALAPWVVDELEEEWGLGA